jgi:hypothetical protein
MRYKIRKSKDYLKRFRIFFCESRLSVSGQLGKVNYPGSFNGEEFYRLYLRRKDRFGFFSSTSFLLKWLEEAFRSVSVGYSVEFTLNSISFKGQFLHFGFALFLDLGYSHSVSFLLPRHAYAFFEKRRMVVLSKDYYWITNVIQRIKGLRYPDDYRAKGIILKNEKFTFKPGKQRQ